MTRLTKNEFIIRAKKIHGQKYDYAVTEYVNSTTKVSIICNAHGVFEQTPKLHMNGCGCPVCGRNNTVKSIKKDTDYFIKQAKKIHGNRYDYSESDYKGAMQHIKIICKKHGPFEQRPNTHIQGSGGCPTCGGTKKKTTEDFINDATKIHGDRYDYKLVQYKNAHGKVNIRCLKHGVFKQSYLTHVTSMGGCPKCAHTKIPTTEEFIENSINIHGNKYDYSKFNYVHSKTKSIIICKKHGEFLQSPNLHLRGHGCPKCRQSLGENKIAKFLSDNNINFIAQHRFSGCRNKRTLPFDFYLPDKKICIEFNGQQHYKSVKFFGGSEALHKRIANDRIKSNYCKENGIKLLVVTGLNINLQEVLLPHL